MEGYMIQLSSKDMNAFMESFKTMTSLKNLHLNFNCHYVNFLSVVSNFPSRKPNEVWLDTFHITNHDLFLSHPLLTKITSKSKYTYIKTQNLMIDVQI